MDMLKQPRYIHTVVGAVCVKSCKYHVLLIIKTTLTPRLISSGHVAVRFLGDKKRLKISVAPAGGNQGSTVHGVAYYHRTSVVSPYCGEHILLKFDEHAVVTKYLKYMLPPYNVYDFIWKRQARRSGRREPVLQTHFFLPRGA